MKQGDDINYGVEVEVGCGKERDGFLEREKEREKKKERERESERERVRERGRNG